ncbi:hypothetical protein ACS0TY_034426 [Phlomoides rotata]
MVYRASNGEVTAASGGSGGEGKVVVVDGGGGEVAVVIGGGGRKVAVVSAGEVMVASSAKSVGQRQDVDRQKNRKN